LIGVIVIVTVDGLEVFPYSAGYGIRDNLYHYKLSSCGMGRIDGNKGMGIEEGHGWIETCKSDAASVHT